jgi:hypothetical protein
MIFDKLQTAGSIRYHYEESISPPGRYIIPDQTRRFTPRRGNAFAQTPTSDLAPAYSSCGRHGSSIETASHPSAFQSEV